MHNFQINFAHPWLLLLLIPAVLFTLLPYFRLAKRYRRTRNRITSIVLHLMVMVLSILALSGITFSYQLTNDENEIIYLVDMSDSEEEAQAKRDEFVELVINDSQYDGYKVGVVTFGYDQVYAAPLTHKVEDVYDTYMGAVLPDTSATNIAAALNYTKDLFTNPQTAKIVLITDGKETDEDAVSAIRSLVAQGIKLDTALIPSEYTGFDAQIISVELPDYHMTTGNEYIAKVTIQSKDVVNATIELMDNGATSSVVPVELIKGTQTVTVPFTFASDKLHQLAFKLTVSTTESLQENNTYHTYHYLHVFKKLLVLERIDGESDALVNMINANNEFEPTVLNIKSANVPTTIEALCDYDQVVLNNIANADMINGFDELLQTYVYEYGGGLFTVGGDKETTQNGNTITTANAYNRKDLIGSIYQEMLPVEAINYTPPLGVMLLIDTSGSMGGDGQYGYSSKLDWAKAGAASCLDALTERDYIGVMTFDDYQSTVLELTPRTQEAKIRAAINTIEKANGGTVNSEAIYRAGQALRALEDVDKRHIILVTDGAISDITNCQSIAQSYYANDGITLSVVSIGLTESSQYYEATKQLVAAGNGRLIMAQPNQLVEEMREELNVEPLKEVNDETFNIKIKDTLSPLVKDLTRLEEHKDILEVTLDGFYGVKIRPTADLILTGNYQVPLYAQWKYGKGMVGSFMCDLSGKRSADFMRSPDGAQFVKNVINNLMPTSDIQPNEIKIQLREDNYTNQLSIYTSLKEGEMVRASILSTSGEVLADLNTVTKLLEGETWSDYPCYVTSSLSLANNYSRCDFVIKEGGVYKILIQKCDANGAVLETLETYKSFAYSEEYDSFKKNGTGSQTPEESLSYLAERGNGAMIADLENPWEIFEGFITDIDKVYDPRFVFMIMAIVLFLLDIAVRKFKFKWPHELIRAYREKRNSK